MRPIEKPDVFAFVEVINRSNKTKTPITVPMLAALTGVSLQKTKHIVRWLEFSDFVMRDPKHQYNLLAVKVG